MKIEDVEKAISECVERIGRVRDRMLDADFRTFEEVRIEVDRELREIGLRLLDLDGAEKVCACGSVQAVVSPGGYACPSCGGKVPAGATRLIESLGSKPSP